MFSSRHFPSATPVARAVRRALALASLSAVALAGMSAQARAQAQEPAVGRSAAAKKHSIPAGPLGEALALFAASAGVSVQLDPALVAGRRTAGLNGSFAAAVGFARLLEGSGLQALEPAPAVFVLRLLPTAQAASAAAAAAEVMPDALPVVRTRAAVLRESAAGPVFGYAATRSATGGKTDQAITEIPQSISVIGAHELQARDVQSVQEALRYTAGVSTEQFGFENRGFDWFLMRGFGTQGGGNFRDGLKLGDVYDLSIANEIYGLERVEILKGPSSVLFGHGDAGGIVNRVSKRPDSESLRELGLQVGSFGRRQLMADLGGALDEAGRLGYRLVATGLDSESQTRYPNGAAVANKRRYVAPSLLWQPSADTSLTLLAEAMDNRAGDDIWYLMGANGELSDVLEGEPGFSWLKNRHQLLAYQLRHRFHPDWELRQNFRQVHAKGSKHHFWTSRAEDGYTLNRTAVLHRNHFDQTLLDTQVEGRLRHGALEHRLLLGLDWNGFSGRSVNWVAEAPALDLRHPVYGQPIPEPDALDGDESQRRQDLGLYVQDQIKIGPQWLLSLGGRWDRSKSHVTDPIYKTDERVHVRAFSGRVGLSYPLAGGVTPYASYAESFQPQSGTGSDGKPFVPTLGRQFELGLKVASADGRSLWTLALFELSKSKVKTKDPADPKERMKQTGEIRSRGLELEARGEIARGLSLVGNYAYTDVRVTRSTGPDLDKMPIQIPRHMASAWLDYSGFGGSLAGLGAAAGWRHVGARHNDETNTLAPQGAYRLADLSLYYERGAMRLALNVSNALNKKYVQSRAWGMAYMGMERQTSVSAKYRF